jgi:hypothetical protein
MPIECFKPISLYGKHRIRNRLLSQHIHELIWLQNTLSYRGGRMPWRWISDT